MRHAQPGMSVLGCGEKNGHAIMESLDLSRRVGGDDRHRRLGVGEGMMRRGADRARAPFVVQASHVQYRRPVRVRVEGRVRVRIRRTVTARAQVRARVRARVRVRVVVIVVIVVIVVRGGERVGIFFRYRLVGGGGGGGGGQVAAVGLLHRRLSGSADSSLRFPLVVRG